MSEEDRTMTGQREGFGKGANFDRDPVHRDERGWWFWDETETDRIGPYKTEGAAREALYQYALSLGGE